MNAILAIDIGGTSIKYALVGTDGRLDERDSRPTPKTSLHELLSALADIMDRFEGRYEALGIALPGSFETDGRTIRSCGALPYLEGVDLGDSLTSHIGSGISLNLVNDAEAAAWAEKTQGSLAGVDDAAIVVLGTGIGSSIFLDGKLLRGPHALAAEPSFMVIDRSRSVPRDRTAAPLSSVDMVHAITPEMQGRPESDRSKAAFSLVRAGDRSAMSVFTAYTETVAAVIFNIQTVLDLDRYAIGGGISAEPLVIERIAQDFESIRTTTDLSAHAIHRPEILAAKFRNDANLIGLGSLCTGSAS